jgi:hypothetical protein
MIVATDQSAVHALSWDDERWFLRYLNRQEHLQGL